MIEDREKNEGRKDWWKPVVLILIIVILFFVMNLYGLGENLEEVQQWVKSVGIWGPLAFFLIYIGAVVATIPGTLFGIIAGALFGSLVGVLIISISSTVGASLTFLIARYFARDAIAHWLSKNRIMRRLDELTEQQGIMIVGLTRLIPLFPFTLLNYGFGLTKVSFKTYVFWSWLGMLPGTIIVVVGTDALTQGITHGRMPWELIAVVLITTVILGLMIWYARRQFREKRKTQEERTSNE